MPKERINIPADTIINDRYRIDSIIGRGGIGTTFKALDLNTNTHVALKALEIERIENLKELELFEREIDVLKKIDNPCIPNYIKHFKTNISNHALYILVQEFVDGKNLYIHIKEGKKYREKEVLKLLKSLLTTLSYIHNLKPPIIHRDINPKNIILDKNNKLYLVDFGAVGRGRKNTLAAAKSDTFVGTLGYMPHEQLFGKLHPGLDIYSLGVTA
jgi:serine/threonine protein kinase